MSKLPQFYVLLGVGEQFLLSNQWGQRRNHLTTVTAAADTADQPDNHKPLHCMIDPGLGKVSQKVVFGEEFLQNQCPVLLRRLWNKKSSLEAG